MEPGLLREAGMGSGNQPSRITVTRAATWASRRGRTTGRPDLRRVASGTATCCAAPAGHLALRGWCAAKGLGERKQLPGTWGHREDE